MSYQVSLGTNGVISFPNDTTLASSGVFWAGCSIRGDVLNGFSGVGGTASIITVGNSGLTTVKAQLTWKNLYTNFVLVDSAGADFVADTHTGTNLGSFNSSLYYDVLFTNDSANAGVSWYMGVYTAGHFNDGSFLLAEWYRVAGSQTNSTSAGTGYSFFGNTGQGSFTGYAQIFDWVKMGPTSSFGTFNAQLEEGAGSSVSPGGTISGSFSWLGTSPAPMRFFRQQSFSRRRRR